MKHRALLLALALAAPAPAAMAQGRPTATMPSFRSTSDMTAFLRRYLDARNSPMRRGLMSDMAAGVMLRTCFFLVLLKWARK